MKLYKKQEIAHPFGIKVTTPLLIPSFSSKDFKFKDKYKYSENEGIISYCSELLTESMLVSAYDIKHNYTPPIQNLKFTDILLIDSGGYETSEVEDLSGTAKYIYPFKEWSYSDLCEVIDLVPPDKAVIIVNFDKLSLNKAFEEQISEAIKFFDLYPNKISDFLIKPERGNYIDVDSLLAHIPKLRSFNIVGFTEKEIGDSILERMIAIGKVRREMDKNGITNPIHIFGSLDPVSTILYFLAGAEIFDGLTWLKYAFSNGKAVYMENYAVFNEHLGVHTKYSSIIKKVISLNINYLEKMKYVMQDFCSSNDFSEFDSLGGEGFGSQIHNSYKTFFVIIQQKLK